MAARQVADSRVFNYLKRDLAGRPQTKLWGSSINAIPNTITAA